MMTDELLQEFRKKFYITLTDIVCWLSMKGITDTIMFSVLGRDIIFKPEEDDEDDMQE